MKKMWAALAALAAAGLLMTGCGGEKKEEAPKAEAVPLLQQIKDRGQLVLGTAADFPPYEFIDTSKSEKTVAGIDINLAQRIADKIGVKLVVQDMNFSALLSSLASKKVDIAISAITPTPERAEAMDFSDIYMSDENIMIIRKSDADKFTKLEDFYGKNIAAAKSTQQEKLAQDYLTDAKIVSLERFGDALMELMQNKVDGVPSQRVVAQQYLLMNPDLADSGAYFEGHASSSAVMVLKGNEDLVALINEVIAECQENGDIERWVQEASELAVKNAQN